MIPKIRIIPVYIRLDYIKSSYVEKKSFLLRKINDEIFKIMDIKTKA
jgi:hypothetical protein